MLLTMHFICFLKISPRLNRISGLSFQDLNLKNLVRQFARWLYKLIKQAIIKCFFAVNPCIV